MLRRILSFTFALLLFALAFSIGVPDRPTAPSELISGKSESPGLIAAALFLPQTAIAQTTASAPGQAIADTSARAAPADQSGRSHALLWGTFALIAAVSFVAWLLNRRRNKPYAYEPQGGSGSPSDNPEQRYRPQRPSAT